MKKKNNDFKVEKELIQLKISANRERHKLKMEELEYLRETNRLFHERELERGRIKSAEIRKAHIRKHGNTQNHH